MKKTFLFLVVILTMATTLTAQWVSPGDGTTYTLPDLVAASDGVVTNDGKIFFVNADITISQNDVLKIDDQVTTINAPDVLITICGSMICENNDRVTLFGTETQHFSMRFENATDCNIKKMYLSDGSGIKLIESEVVFDDVKFLYFTKDYCNAVIDVFNCDPVIKDCYFLMNGGAAVSSPANGQSSPQILNCILDANVSDINSPQINLGPGGNDTIRIVGNEIDDTYATWFVGGISVADLLGTGSTKVLVKDNIVRGGRYGYNQQGQTISSVIVGNQFIENNKESNPMNGGSGISIYGTSADCKAVLRHNLITGNLWGITAIYMNDIDLGNAADWGYNEIHGNGNGGVLYELYNNSTCDIAAVGNYWGTTDENEVEDLIYHQNDDAGLGLVTFSPIWANDDAVSEIHEDGSVRDKRFYSIEGRYLGEEVPANYRGVYIQSGKRFFRP